MQENDLYGFWKLLEFPKNRQVACLCTKCNKTIKNVDTVALKRGSTKSCGCSSIKKDIQVGKTFGILTILAKGKARGGWICQCSCGSKKEVRSTDLRRGSVKSCGCQSFRKKYKIQEGNFFGDWIVLNPPKKGDRAVACQCKRCGINKQLDYTFLLRTDAPSCSCSFATQSLVEGRVIGHWKILSNQGRRSLCQCLGCFVVKSLDKQSLLHNMTRSCGCVNSTYSKETCLQKYKTTHYASSQMAREKRIADDVYTTLSDGTILKDLCEVKGMSISTASQFYRKNGEAAFWDFYNNYTPSIYSTEALLINLLQDTFLMQKYDCHPKEFKTSYRPDFRIAQNNKVLYINVDGLYWHSKGRNLKRNYHFELRRAFQENNFQLMQFYSSELEERPSIVKSIILNQFGLTTNYYARKLVLREVPSQISTSFFETNHLMGKGPSARSYGLYEKDQLLCCLSFKLKNKTLEIIRFANKNFCKVIGGFSRLLTHITKLLDPTIIESWCDLRYSTGQSYEKLGFKLEKTILSWKWTDFKKTYNRLQCRANMDERKLSQVAYAEELGWYKIYDAGQAKYIKRLK